MYRTASRFEVDSHCARHKAGRKAPPLEAEAFDLEIATALEDIESLTKEECAAIMRAMDRTGYPSDCEPVAVFLALHARLSWVLAAPHGRAFCSLLRSWGANRAIDVQLWKHWGIYYRPNYRAGKQLTEDDVAHMIKNACADDLICVSSRIGSSMQSETANAVSTDAGTIFTMPPFSDFFAVVGSSATATATASLRVTKEAPTFGRFGLTLGREVFVMTGSRRPDHDDVILLQQAGIAVVGRFGSMPGASPSIPVRRLDRDGITLGYAWINAIGPNEVPNLEIGQRVVLKCGVNGWSESAAVERITSRSYHFRFLGEQRRRGKIAVAFDDLRRGLFAALSSERQRAIA